MGRASIVAVSSFVLLFLSWLFVPKGPCTQVGYTLIETLRVCFLLPSCKLHGHVASQTMCPVCRVPVTTPGRLGRDIEALLFPS